MKALTSPRGMRMPVSGNNGRVKLPAVAAPCRGTGKGVSECRMCARPPAMNADAAKGPAISRGGHGFNLSVVALLMSATAPAGRGRVCFEERLPLHVAGYNRRNHRSGFWQINV
jgi:hypothetical protein